MKLSKQDYFKALLAGIAIGVANVTAYTVNNLYMAAFLYSFYALMIYKFDLKLFTSQVSYWTFHLGAYIEMIILNFFGSIIPVMLMVRKEDLPTIMDTAVRAYDRPAFVLFSVAVITGGIVHAAHESKSELITVVSVMILIVCDLRHCIIDFGLILISRQVCFTIKFILVMFGNTLGAYLIHKIAKCSKTIEGHNL